MNSISNNEIDSKLAVERLTVLWALTESGLGGMMHAFRLPFTGLLVGGVAIILIIMLAHYSNNNVQQILKALIIVLIVKISVSPHSPLGAYLAVSF